ncbi:glycosyltransferase family 2 protein [Chitinophagaceae bacterium LB-8]|uniref:Glycosyltransferase family 2 protein n=1 Tax=Paraflavisolibacter caeni TaxID=2982496 RepID=A0A9X2XYQ4_9BACT|nr:glycosyltransferase family A protein [Paraflavisolibacter caeni]MCU7551292.1 glycosyltransferase family 2 protein [Paraflavisolibacter caeni]
MSSVSVIMPAYNAAKYISASIESVLQQTYSNWELIVVDDGSKDDTKAIVLAYVQKDNRIKYHWQPNGKLGNARNSGIRNATGKWITFLDSDDLWACNKLEKQIEAAHKNKDVDVIFTGGYFFNDDDLTKLTPYPTLLGKFGPKEMYKLEYQSNYIANLSVMVKREYIDKIGFQDEHRFIYGCEDWDYWIRLAKGGATFLGIEDQLFYYRRHSSNMSNDHLTMRIAEAFVYIKNFVPDLLPEDFKEIKYNNFFVPLIEELLSKNKIEEVKYIASKYATIEPSFYKKMYKFIITILGRKAYYPCKVINKVRSTI